MPRPATTAKRPRTRSRRTTRANGNVFADLGFSPLESASLQLRASSSRSRRMLRGGWPEMPQVESDLEETSWRHELERAFAKTGDSWSDIESMTLSDDALSRRFHAGWGSTDGEPFTLWTRRFVYFPWRYDGSQSVAWVSRHPDGIATEPIGGG